MASLPNPIQVSGKHNAIYEAYYKQIDPKGVGSIEAIDAAKFLKKSGLSDVVLSRIWDLSEPKGVGYLDKNGFFVALKLIALAQSGKEISMRQILTETQNPPKVGDIPKILPKTVQLVEATSANWSIKEDEKKEYFKLFDSLKPIDGYIAGNKVKDFLIKSQLPLDTLGRIWDLADQDKDGNLDKHEFAVAVHLVHQALDKGLVPSTLPSELQKEKIHNENIGNGGFVAEFPKNIAPPPVPPLPTSIKNTSTIQKSAVNNIDIISTIPALSTKQQFQQVDWVVTKEDLLKFKKIFEECDLDKDGLVSGLEVKDVFLKSTVHQLILAHIWALCDTNQTGKLTLEQFALAMWMVERKKNGIEPPQILAPNMVPPSMRGLTGLETSTKPVVEAPPTYNNPELEMISKEIGELAKERHSLETDIAQREADIRIKSGEVKSLQSELDTLAATLKQLENQKGEAQKRLDDLKSQKIEVNQALESITYIVKEAKHQVDKIREQCKKQEEIINEQESELNSKRSELQKLKDEEASLEKEYEASNKELENLTKKLQNTQIEISQIKAMVTQLLEMKRQMSDALLLCKAAIEANDAVIVSDYSLKIEPDLNEAKCILAKGINKQNDDFDNQENNKNMGNKIASNGFSKDTFNNAYQDSNVGFDDNFDNISGSQFDNNFGSDFSKNHLKNSYNNSQLNDPFGDQKTSNKIIQDSGKDEFGSDPFAILHAPVAGQMTISGTHKTGPPPRPESPSPALPPKKSKQPPPRPAPPRALQGPIRPAPPSSDLFTSSAGGFTDFADFDKHLNLQQHTVKSTNIFETKTTTTNMEKPADFSEDPFKDYRYEDPFGIEDPFSEEAADLSDSGDNIDYNQRKEKNNSNILEKSVDIDKHQPKLDIIDDNFANFDAFGLNNINNNNNNIKNAEFFDNFNDNFKNINKNSIKATSTVFNAFGDLNTDLTNSNTNFDAFNDNFEDEFHKTEIKSNGNISKNFANFDNLEIMNRKNLNNKNMNNNINDIKANKFNNNKISTKFNTDYSRTDSFDADLEAVLQRSLVEK